MFLNHLLSTDVKNFKFRLPHTTTSKLSFMTRWSMVPSIRFKTAIMELIENCLPTTFYAPWRSIIYGRTYSKTPELWPKSCHRYIQIELMIHTTWSDNLQPVIQQTPAKTWMKECGTLSASERNNAVARWFNTSSITLTWWNQQLDSCVFFLIWIVFFASAGGFIMHPWITQLNFPSWFDQHIR